MGFRFHNLNPMYKWYLCRVSSQSHKNVNPYPIIQSLNCENPIYKIPRRWHLGHSHDHRHDQGSVEEGENIFRLGLAADIGLATGKALTGYLSGSTAIIADAAHSVSDVVISNFHFYYFYFSILFNYFFYSLFAAGSKWNCLVVIQSCQNSSRQRTPIWSLIICHGKFETLGALGISCMLLATAGGIAWHAFHLLLGLMSTAPEVFTHGHNHGIDMNHPILALNMTIVSISVKEGLYWITKRAGERQGSGLMKANAWHHRSDAISSVVALIGVGGSILGVKFLDPLAGIVVSGMIFKAGLEGGYQSVLELVDAAIPPQHLEPMKQTILQVEGVKGCHRLRGRRAGSTLYLDVHIEVDPFSTVSAAHCIGENVRHQIHKSHPEVSEVFIHIDPAYLEFSPSIIDQPESLEETTLENRNIYLEDKDVEAIISNISLSKFPKKMVVERITRHLLQGKVFLQIEVTMPPDILIRDAMELAEEAEQEILKAASNIVQVSIQLRLGRPIPQFHKK